MGSRIGGTGFRRRFRKVVSGELATKLTGRCVEFDMFTLGFGECLQMKRHLGQALENDAREFETWLREGGFPRSLGFTDPQAKDAYARDVVDQNAARATRTPG